MYDDGLVGALRLVVDGDRVGGEHLPGPAGIELSETICLLARSVRALESGDEPVRYPFCCGGCGEAGCTQVRLWGRRDGEDVRLRVRGREETLCAGRIRVEALARAVASLVGDVLAATDPSALADANLPSARVCGVRSATDLAALRDDLARD